MELWKFGGHWSVWSLLRNKKIKRESVIGGVNGVNVANGDMIFWVKKVLKFYF